MLPTIRPGSRVLIRRAGADEVQCGDIVLINRDSGFRLHRLVSVLSAPDDMQLITRGDNDMGNDPPVSASLLLGVFAGIEGTPAKWRRLSLFLHSFFARAEQA